jgi:hypothetical protein
MTTVAAIALEAFDEIAAEFSTGDVVYTATLDHDQMESDFQVSWGLITVVADDPAEQVDFGLISDPSTVSVDYGLITDETFGYDFATGTYSPVSAVIYTGGRAIETTADHIDNSFPDYVNGPDDVVVLLQGFTATPENGWRVNYNGKIKTVKAIGDIVGAGTFFEVVAA